MTSIFAVFYCITLFSEYAPLFNVTVFNLAGIAFLSILPAQYLGHLLAKSYPDDEGWEAALQGAPGWMVKLLRLVFVLFVLSFIPNWFTADLRHNPAGDLFFVMGAMLFIYFACCIYVAYILDYHNQEKITCKNLHTVQASFRYCPVCGEKITHKTHAL